MDEEFLNLTFGFVIFFLKRGVCDFRKRRVNEYSFHFVLLWGRSWACILNREEFRSPKLEILSSSLGLSSRLHGGDGGVGEEYHHRPLLHETSESVDVSGSGSWIFIRPGYESKGMT